MRGESFNAQKEKKEKNMLLDCGNMEVN